MTPIFKKHLKSDVNNHRLISVILVVSKVLEKLVYDQLYHNLNDNKLLSSCQSGFRSLHSTLSALFEATKSWSVNIGNAFLNGVVFIDIKKAFDTIDHVIQFTQDVIPWGRPGNYHLVSIVPKQSDTKI